MANFCPCLTPIWGMLIFLMRPSMWGHMVLPLVISFVLTIGVVVALYVPAVEDWQVTELEKFSEEYEPSFFGHNFTEIFNEDNRDNVKIGLKVAAPFEAALVAYISFQALFSKVFGKLAMLCLEERAAYTDFLEKHNLTDEAPEGGPWGCLCSTIVSLALLLATLSLNFFPIIGQVLFALANGWLYTWLNISDLLTIIGYKSFSSQLKHMLCCPPVNVCTPTFSSAPFASASPSSPSWGCWPLVASPAHPLSCSRATSRRARWAPTSRRANPRSPRSTRLAPRSQQLLPPSGGSGLPRPSAPPPGGSARPGGGGDAAQGGRSFRGAGGAGVRGQA
ncbi:unnamed protein product, partial [Prorocentrum cordatum]